jgi:hypothetical protein
MKIILNLIIALLFYSCNSQTDSSENQLMKCIYESCLDDGSEFKEAILKYENELIINKILNDKKENQTNWFSFLFMSFPFCIKLR